MLESFRKGVEALRKDGRRRAADKIVGIVRGAVSKGFHPDNEQIPAEFLPIPRKKGPEKKIRNETPGIDVRTLEEYRDPDSPTLNIERIRAAKVEGKIKDLFGEAKTNITIDGDESIFHLGLPTGVRHLVQRSEIHRIEALRSKIDFLYGAGPVAKKTIDDAIRLYDERLAKLNKK